MERPLLPSSTEEPGGTLQRSSSHLLRAASSAFGGTPGRSPAGDGASPAQALRQRSRSIVQQRMMEQLWNRFPMRMVIVVSTMVLIGISIILLFLNELYAVIRYGTLACDQPLNLYLIISVLVGLITPRIVQRLQRESDLQSRPLAVALSVAGSIPGPMVVMWGAFMVSSCKTCQFTNPALYFPTEYFIYGQVVLFVLRTMFCSFQVAGVVSYWSTIPDSAQLGCEAEVHALHKVGASAPELIDDDGNVMECPICVETFEDRKFVVRTHCGHLFHEACLARWCMNHMDCPICRSPIGEDGGCCAVDDCTP